MLGLMQDTPLVLSSLIDYAAKFHGEVEVVSRTATGAIERSTYARVAERSRRLAAALRSLGVEPGARVASLAVNSTRHLELYYGVTGAGAVLNTVNPRLFPDQIAYILDHADNTYVFFDPAFAGLLEPLAPFAPQVRGYVVLCARAEMPDAALPNLMCFEDLLAAQPGDAAWSPSF